jgi:hypothetical protein
VEAGDSPAQAQAAALSLFGIPGSQAALDRTAEGSCPHVSHSVGEWRGYFERLLEQGRAARAEHDGVSYWWQRSAQRHFHCCSLALGLIARSRRLGRLCRHRKMRSWHWSRVGCRTWVRRQLRNLALCSGFPLLKSTRLCFVWKPRGPCCADNLRHRLAGESPAPARGGARTGVVRAALVGAHSSLDGGHAAKTD